MARFEYDFPFRSDERYRYREGRAARPPLGYRRPPRAYRRRPPFPAGPAYGEEYRIRARMGLHDFTENYGRYSGGSPYDYEYSERTIEHHHPRPEHDIGFTRPLHEESFRRFPVYGRGPGLRRRRRRE